MSPISKRIFIFLLFFTVTSKAHRPSCPPSSCGNIRNITFPFRLRGDPVSCGHHDPSFQLDCENNQTIFTIRSRRYNVLDINYKENLIRLVEPNINRGNLSSCPVYSDTYGDWSRSIFDIYPSWNVPVMFTDCLVPFNSSNYVESAFCGNRSNILNVHVVFTHCLVPVNSLNYVESAFCGNRSSILSNSSEIHSYVFVGESILDLENSCTVDRVAQVSHRRIMNKSSLASIYDGLGYGFELLWVVPITDLVTGFRYLFWGVAIWIYGSLAIVVILVLRFLCGFPFLIGLVVYKWRRRHLSMDETIEKFLQGQNNLTPIKYTYSEIKKMTNNFSQRLGEGGYGTVCKGKLRSGPYVAIKLMGQTIPSEREFISEVGTIGRIHHVNVVQLIGFCVEGSKCALVYEFLPNGSLDRYIFSPQGLGGAALSYEKTFQIALGVARGIDYLHHGCDMHILHFDIKPHNILLDESFNPKISDFGLAKLYSSGGSAINLTSARGTIGYMAPEMFYKNVGVVSYKADVYSFGMLLMEMAGRRRNMNPFADDVSQIFFPSWAYDQYSAGNEIEMNGATDEERKMVKKIILVALWCIQMKPSDRPPMNKVVEMLEGDSELEMPPKPFVAPREILEDHGISTDPLV